MNYADYGDGTLPESSVTGKAQCPECGRWVMKFLLLKVTAVDNTPHDWACDGCWTDWQRHQKSVKPGRTPASELDWFSEFIEELGINPDEHAMHRANAKAELEQKVGDLNRERGIAPPGRQGEIDVELVKLNARLNGRYRDR